MQIQQDKWYAREYRGTSGVLYWTRFECFLLELLPTGLQVIRKVVDDGGAVGDNIVESVREVTLKEQQYLNLLGGTNEEAH